MIGEKIANLRKQKGLSQEDIAKKLYVSRQAVSKWEKNQSLPDIEKINELCKLFGVSSDYLINDTDTYQISSGKETTDFENQTVIKNSQAKPFIMICIGVALLLIITILSSLVPAHVKVSREINSDDIIALSPTENGEYVADGKTVQMSRYEDITGNTFAFINTYYLHGVVLAALILIIGGIYKILKNRKSCRKES